MRGDRKGQENPWAKHKVRRNIRRNINHLVELTTKLHRVRPTPGPVLERSVV